MHCNDEQSDGEVPIVNAAGGSRYANIYVFDDVEEMAECCSECLTPNGFV